MKKKKLLITVGLMSASLITFAQNVNIPDANFKAYLVSNSAINTNSDTEIQVSEAIAFTGTISCSSQSISDLTGISAFVNLDRLVCEYNSLTALDLSQNTALTEVYLTLNDLISLNVSQCTNLTFLKFQGNDIGSIDLTNNTALTDLYCNYNSLSTIDLSQNTALTFLALNGNLFSSLDLSQQAAVETLVCGDNPNLTSLDLSNNTSIINLNANTTANTGNLSSIILGQNTNLTSLSCQSNSLASIDLSGCPNITFMDFSDCNLTSIDLSTNIALINIRLNYNKLSELDLSNNINLGSVNCTNNYNLSELDLSNNINLGAVNCINNYNLAKLNLKNVSTSAGLHATQNPNLTCIEVDDVADATANWTNIDATASFSLDCQSLSISDFELSKNISLYPNPVKSQINISTDENIEYVSIIDISGNVMERLSTDYKLIDISNLSNGIYFLRIDTDKETAIKKFIKE